MYVKKKRCIICDGESNVLIGIQVAKYVLYMCGLYLVRFILSVSH